MGTLGCLVIKNVKKYLALQGFVNLMDGKYTVSHALLTVNSN